MSDFRDDFWDNANSFFVDERTANTVDEYLQNEFGGEQARSVRALVASQAPEDIWKGGIRVSFDTENLEALLTYSDVPDPGTLGTVVTVRTGNGDTTIDNDRVFVLWDDGKFRAIQADHLTIESARKTANAVRMVVADLGDLSAFFVSGSSGEDLVHKATKDLWSLRKDGDNYVVERLFSEDGEPLKV